MADAFKNRLSPDLVRCIAHHLTRRLDAEAGSTFESLCLPTLQKLELKARVQLLGDALLAVLPDDVASRNRILTSMLHPDCDLETLERTSDEQGIAGWGIWPLSLVVGQHGLADFEGSMEVLRQMTMRSTSEFAIRHFLQADQSRALAIMHRWLDDPSHHVRRLVSEGSRPRLPWGMKLHALCDDPRPTLPLLEALKDDPSDYVRRSVANHLNDISREDQALAMATARRWMQDADPQRQALLRHACRTLIKSGNAEILALFGHAPPRLIIGDTTLSATTIRIGDTLHFGIDLCSDSDQEQRLIIDYAVHFRLANGSLSPRIFKGGVVTMAPGQHLHFARRHSFRPITTRRYHAGEQGLSFRINGVDTARSTFRLESS